MIKRLTYLLLLIVFIINISKAANLDPVKMNCAQVNTDGSVTIYWENPADLSDFKKYYIYWSAGSAFMLLDSLSVISDFYTHNTNLGNLIELSYYVDIVDINDISNLSDTISNFYVQLDNNEPDFNKADLYFTLVSDPPPQGTVGDYQIYWDYPDGNWNLIGSSDDGFFSTDVFVCYDSINFKVELENQNGCKSVSNVVGNWFKDVDYPLQTVFDSVSINEDSRAILGWQPSASQDVAGYILYHLVSGKWKELDTVIGLNNTFYIDTLYDACLETHEYAIASIDSCGNKSEGTFLEPQNSIFLYDIGFNVCAHQDTLIWEQYLNAEPEVENYLVWRSDNGTDFNIVGTLSSPENDTVKMQFIDEGIDPGINYEYFIQAVFENGTSSSCKKTVDSYSYKVPQHIYFANVDVLPTNEIDLVVDVDTSVYSCTWDLYRYDPLSNGDEKFSSTNKSQLQGFPLNILDTDVDPPSTYYEYYAMVYDSCGIERFKSNILKTIHLSGSKLNEQTNSLEWTALVGWETSVEKYYIYRIIGNETNALLIDSVSGQTFQYDDLISSNLATEGKLTYWIEAKQTAGGAYDWQSFSNSNRIDIFFESNIYFANAFRPGGLNNEFKPIFNYFSGSDYLFQIFNRWGQLIFETSDIEEGWNGLIDGQNQVSGIYVYRLSYKNVYGIGEDMKGTVMLLQ